MSKQANKASTPKPLLALTATALLLFSLLFYAYCARVLPPQFNVDNYANKAATQYLAEHQQLPFISSENADLRFSNLGTTRLSRPPFTYIVSVVLYKASGAFVEDQQLRLRLGSVLLGAVTVVAAFYALYFAFNSMGLALCGSVFFGALPRFTFLASSNNDDVGAVLAGTLLFGSVVLVARAGLTRSSVVFLSTAVGITLMSKFTAWLLLPWGLLALVLQLRGQRKKLFDFLPIALVVVVIAGAWWPINNMWSYGWSDPTGLKNSAQVQYEITQLTPNREGYWSQGVTAIDLLKNEDEFLSHSFKSSAGYLQWLDLEMHFGWYLSLGIVLLGALITGCRAFILPREDGAYLNIILALAVGSQYAFYVHHNLLRDIQPDSRYLLPVLVPLLLLFGFGLVRLLSSVQASTRWPFFSSGQTEFNMPKPLSLFLILCLAWLSISNFRHNIIPAFRQISYHTQITPNRSLSGKDIFEDAEFMGLDVQREAVWYEVTRRDAAMAEIRFSRELCAQLPLNSILELRVKAPVQGSIGLQVIDSGSDRYRDTQWQPYSAGESTLLFAQNTAACVEVRLVFSPTTVLLALSAPKVHELRIHRFGNPLPPN